MADKAVTMSIVYDLDTHVYHRWKHTNRFSQHVHASVSWLQNPGGRGGTEQTVMLALRITFCIRTYLPDAILPAAKVEKNGRGAHWPAPFALSIQYTRS